MAWDLKPQSQLSVTSFNMSIPPDPFETVAPTVDPVIKYMILCGLFLFKLPQRRNNPYKDVLQWYQSILIQNKLKTKQ